MRPKTKEAETDVGRVVNALVVVLVPGGAGVKETVAAPREIAT